MGGDKPTLGNFIPITYFGEISVKGGIRQTLQFNGFSQDAIA
jgi:hypothetical protein